MKIKGPKVQATPPPPPPAPLPTEDDATIAARRAKALAEMRGRRGRGATLLSRGPLGDGGAARGQASAYKPLLA